MNDHEKADDSVQHALDRDAALLESAVRLVASGQAPSVTVAGLQLAVAAIAVVTPLAAEQGIALDPLWGVDQTLTDVRVRRA